MPAFALSLAWMLAWPYQRPWYDAAVLCLLVLYPASRLDWVILGQLAVGTVEFMPGMPSFPPRHSWLSAALDVQCNLVMPLVRLAALLAVVALCVTGAWYARGPGHPPRARWSVLCDQCANDCRWPGGASGTWLRGCAASVRTCH